MITDERYAKIVEITNSRGFISTKELAQKLNVTETTIRRDCDELSKKNLIMFTEEPKAFNTEIFFQIVMKKT